jgi:hypothetical protein
VRVARMCLRRRCVFHRRTGSKCGPHLGEPLCRIWKRLIPQLATRGIGHECRPSFP